MTGQENVVADALVTSFSYIITDQKSAYSSAVSSMHVLKFDPFRSYFLLRMFWWFVCQVLNCKSDLLHILANWKVVLWWRSCGTLALLGTGDDPLQTLWMLLVYFEGTAGRRGQSDLLEWGTPHFITRVGKPRPCVSAALKDLWSSVSLTFLCLRQLFGMVCCSVCVAAPYNTTTLDHCTLPLMHLPFLLIPLITHTMLTLSYPYIN